MGVNGAVPSLRERLAVRERPSLPFRLLVADPAESMGRLTAAQADLRQIVLGERDDDARAAAQAMVDAARADVEACWVMITFQALPPHEYEQLQAAHPPTIEQAANREMWNPDTFRPALLAACADGDMSEDDWVDFLASRCSSGEKQGLYVTALAVNEQARAADPLVLPKGLT